MMMMMVMMMHHLEASCHEEGRGYTRAHHARPHHAHDADIVERRLRRRLAR